MDIVVRVSTPARTLFTRDTLRKEEKLETDEGPKQANTRSFD